MLLDIEKLLPVIAMLWGWGLTSLIVNLGVSGAWILQGEALRVTDTDAEFYANCSVSAVLATAEEEKKCKYLSGLVLRHASFTILLGQLMGETLANGFIAPCRMVKFVIGYGRKQIAS